MCTTEVDMKKYSFLLVCLVLTLFVNAQKAVISFDVKEHDFGKVNEEDGKISYIFDFYNKGMTPLVLSKVEASCGCTTPTWTKEPIEPGKKGAITVTYNPSGRPGTFTKTISVSSNAIEEQVTLKIKGEVIPKLNAENNPYPVNIGGLLSKAKVVQMNNMNKGDKQVRTLEIQNSNKFPIKPTFEALPPYITASVFPETLNFNEVGKITFTFNSKYCSQWGPISDDIYVVLNGQKKYSDEYKLIVVGNVVEDFSKLTFDQRRAAPILEMPVKYMNLGDIKTNSKRTAKFKVINKGINSLEIRRVINQNKEFTVSQSKMSIASGKSAQIVAVLNTKGLNDGEYKKSFTIQTNDPDNSFLILVLSWNVVK
jgi:hypothetical protein